jgi:hypothetical protein
MKYEAVKNPTTGRWIAIQTALGKLTKAEAKRVCQIKNGRNVRPRSAAFATALPAH